MQNVELETAEALLDIGVSVPFKEIKVPFTHKRIALRLTMKRPCLGNRIRIARQYLKLGHTADEIEAFTSEEDMVFMAKQGHRLSLMIALTVCRGALSGLLLAPVVAFAIRWFVPDRFIKGANLQFITLLGTKSFTNIIRSVEAANPLSPRLSQPEKGS